MSDFKPLLLARFYDRRSNAKITTVPIVNRITLNQDMRQLTDSFDFDILYRRADKVDLRSHDFVEFYFKDEAGHECQVGCGFVELIASDTTASSHRYQANGRDFLGQLFSLPFLQAKKFDQTTLVSFLNYCLAGTYLKDYLAIQGLTVSVKDRGSYTGAVGIQELTDARIAPVLQTTADDVVNTIYQNRFGQAVIYGRSNRLESSFVTGLTLSEFNDVNVSSMSLRRDFSKVITEVKINYTGSAGGVDYALQPGIPLYNSDPDVKNIFQPEIRTYNFPDLVKTPGNNYYNDKMTVFAQSLIRKSNQNLRQVVVKTNKPFFLKSDGSRRWYEKGLVFTINNQSHNILEDMMLVGISYEQDESNLNIQLLFVGVDTLV